MARRPFLLAMLLAAHLGSAAPAQTAAEPGLVEAFSGSWFSFDADSGAGGICSLELQGAVQEDGRRRAIPRDCAGALASVASWDIREGQISLIEPGSGSVVAALGGNQFRMTGARADGGYLVLERQAGDPNSRRIRDAISVYRCIYLGYSDRCARPEELRLPEFGAAEAPRVSLLVNLNMRREPRADAPLVGIVDRGTQLSVERCLVASDGPWCAARFGDEIGWFARTALRRGTWPVATFTPVGPEP